MGSALPHGSHDSSCKELVALPAMGQLSGSSSAGHFLALVLPGPVLDLLAFMPKGEGWLLCFHPRGDSGHFQRQTCAELQKLPVPQEVVFFSDEGVPFLAHGPDPA